jgi:RNA polymerase sigma-70 factor, ECF subfamily
MLAPASSRSSSVSSSASISSAALSAFSAPAAAKVDDYVVTVGWPEMVSHRDYLVRFARRKLHDPSQAEDVVHDVFEAVISGHAVFGGRAALRSWLTAILKNKLVDLIHQRARYQSLDMDDDGESDDMPQMMSEGAGPEEIAEQRERLAQTLHRIAKLPQGLRDVVNFRVLQDESSGAVCKRLRISEASLFVRLHRARKQLLC